jgi:hypothetical protein
MLNLTSDCLDLSRDWHKPAERKSALLYQHLLLTAEMMKFWRRLESVEPPHLFGAESPNGRSIVSHIIGSHLRQTRQRG